VKTAISVPDPLFAAAERMSRKLGISRSRLYALAVEAYLKSHRTRGVKEALDEVYQSEASELDPALRAMQDASLSRENW
jgi:metal-responsive CopG/Arc/MetJ family transcriptional regulator